MLTPVKRRRVTPFRHPAVRRIPFSPVVHAGVAGVAAAAHAAQRAARYVARQLSQYSPVHRRLHHRVTRRNATRSNLLAAKSMSVRPIIGKPFKKPKRFKPDIFARKGAILKVEHSQLTTDTECVYVGHHSLPAEFAFRTAIYALVRKMAEMAGQYIGNFQQSINGTSGPSNLRITMYYTTEPTGAVTSTLNGVSTTTWQALADSINSAIMTEIQNLLTEDFIVKDIVLEDIGTTNNKIPTQIIKGSDLRVRVVGTSNMQLQNRTIASNTVTTRTTADDVAANPVRGKCYSGRGNDLTLQDDVDVSNVARALAFDNTTGAGAIGSQSLTLSTTARQTLRKPPLAGAFKNVTKQRYVKMKPGEVRRSKCQGKMYCSLNDFICKFFKVIKAGSGGTWDAFCRFPYGETIFYGLERMCDVGSDEPVVSVGFEIITTMNALVTYRPQKCVTSLNLQR